MTKNRKPAPRSSLKASQGTGGNPPAPICREDRPGKTFSQLGLTYACISLKSREDCCLGFATTRHVIWFLQRRPHAYCILISILLHPVSIARANTNGFLEESYISCSRKLYRACDVFIFLQLLGQETVVLAYSGEELARALEHQVTLQDVYQITRYKQHLFLIL